MDYYGGVESMLGWEVGWGGRGRGRRQRRSRYLRGDFNIVNVEAVDNVAGDGVA